MLLISKKFSVISKVKMYQKSRQPQYDAYIVQFLFRQLKHTWSNDKHLDRMFCVFYEFQLLVLTVLRLAGSQ